MDYHRPIGAEEFLEWCDCFSKTTGLGPKSSAEIYAELCNLRGVTVLFDVIATRDKHLIDTSNMSFSSEYFSWLEKQGDEHVSEDVRSERYEWYYQILSHHGFDDGFIQMFCQNLSPSSEEGHTSFIFDGKDSVDSWFNPRPYLQKEKMEDEVYFRYNPYRPTFATRKWSNLFQFLGFQVEIDAKVKPREVPYDQELFTLIDNNGEYASVFNLGEVGFPFESGSSMALRAKEKCEHYFNFLEHLSAVLILWDSPVAMYVDSNDDPIVFCGFIFAESEWLPLVISGEAINVQELSNFAELATKSYAEAYQDDLIDILADEDSIALSKLFAKGKIDKSKITVINVSRKVCN